MLWPPSLIAYKYTVNAETVCMYNIRSKCIVNAEIVCIYNIRSKRINTTYHHSHICIHTSITQLLPASTARAACSFSTFNARELSGLSTEIHHCSYCCGCSVLLLVKSQRIVCCHPVQVRVQQLTELEEVVSYKEALAR
jgi:hypothetical protein